MGKECAACGERIGSARSMDVGEIFDGFKNEYGDDEFDIAGYRGSDEIHERCSFDVHSDLWYANGYPNRGKIARKISQEMDKEDWKLDRFEQQFHAAYESAMNTLSDQEQRELEEGIRKRRKEYIREQQTPRRQDNNECVIATAAYGTPFATDIDALRLWRDQRLKSRALGRAIISFYYRVGPPVADFIAERPRAMTVTRLILRPLVHVAKRSYPPNESENN